jgi:hypothetical protein
MAYEALSFTFFRPARFPELQDTLTVPSQIVLFQDATDTWVRRLPGHVVPGTYRMEAHHDVRVSVAGRTQGIVFTEYVRSHNFTVCHNPKRSLFWADAPRAIAEDFVDTLNHSELVSLVPQEIDIDRLYEQIPDLRGMWLHTREAHLKSVGAFGEQVDESALVRRARATGATISSVLLRFTLGGRELSTQVGRWGSVVVSTPLMSAGQRSLELEVTAQLAIYDELLASVIHDYQPKRQSRKSKAEPDSEPGTGSDTGELPFGTDDEQDS